MHEHQGHKPYRAILTGASGGIGKAIARELVARCDWLILAGRNVGALEALRYELGTGKTQVVSGDLAQDETLRAIAARAMDMGGVNLLVNNAGASDFHAFATQDAAAIRRMLDTNLLAPMLLCRRMIPLLETAPRAQIVNIGSVFGQVGFPGFGAYCASKAGLRGFTQALRRELADTSVDVRHFAPRATRTPINSDAVTAMNRELKTAEDAPEEVARAFMQFLRGSRWESTVGAKESFFVLLNQLAPAMPDRAILGQLRTIRKYLPK